MNISQNAREVYTHNRDLFLRAMFVSPEHREALLTFYALIVELDKIPAGVSEEMIGHIKYAWWDEAIQGLYTGKPTQGHPVLEGLTPLTSSGVLPQSALTPIIVQYRTHFPQSPHADEVIVAASRQLIEKLDPASIKRWDRADEIISSHRRRLGAGWNGWLNLKLLLA